VTPNNTHILHDYQMFLTTLFYKSASVDQNYHISCRLSLIISKMHAICKQTQLSNIINIIHAQLYSSLRFIGKIDFEIAVICF